MTSFQLVYGIILLIGVLALVVTLFMGDFEHDFDHDIDSSVDGPSWFGLNMISVMLIGIGGIGLMAVYYGDVEGGPSVIVAVAGGLFFGYLIRQFVLKPLFRQQYNSLLNANSYVGLKANVTICVEPRGIGQVRFRDNNGATVLRTARTDGAEPLDVGQTVIITDVTAGHVVVEHPLHVPNN